MSAPKVLGIDPGTESPGFAVYDWLTLRFLYAGDTLPTFQVDAIVTESSWPHGKAGKTQMWGLGWRAAWQTRDALALSPRARVYTITPKLWRNAVGLPDSLEKRAIVARLRLIRYAPLGVGAETADVIEACGIAEGGAILLANPLRRGRLGFKEVKVT